MATENYPHMVTGGPEEIRHNPHMVTATQEEIPYCSATTSSGKQKKARAPQVNLNFAERIPLRQLKQTGFFGRSAIGDELQFSQFQ